MVVSLGPQGTLVMGANTEPVTWTQHQRHVLWTCVSSVSTKGDTSSAHASPQSQRKDTLALNPRLLCLDERRHFLFTCVSCILTKGDTCWKRVSPLSWWKETLLVYVRLPCLDERRHILAMRVSYDPSMSWFHMHLIKLDLASKFTEIYIIHMHFICT
jgi:hypothetical protein